MGVNAIPPEFKAEQRWIVWKWEGEEKPPHIATKVYGKLKVVGHASSTSSKTWTDFATASAVVEAGLADGLGYALEEGYIFVDIDDCIVDGKVSPEAQAIIDRLDSYCEVSQSGSGVHVIMKGKKPTDKCRRGNVEIYDHSRFIYLTGDILGERRTIEERDVAWLCEQTFGEATETTEPVEVDDLVLDRDAMPPPDKLDVLKKDRDFKKTWNHQRDEFKSLSEYDLSLAGFATRRGWSDQEAADLIIAFRRQHGNDKDLKKALRQDYIRRTLAQVKPKANDAQVLDLLPFKVAKVIQYGESDASVTLVLDNGQKIDMGSTELFLSARRARARLWQSDYDLPAKAEKRWRDITKALIALKEKKITLSTDEKTREWLYDYIGTRSSMPKAEEDGDIGKIFANGRIAIAEDKEGRIYLRLSNITRYVRVHTGAGNITQQGVAKNLIEAGFQKLKKKRVAEDGVPRQINLWVSPRRFLDEEV